MSIPNLGALWLAVLAELENMTGEPADDDDDGMQTVDTASLELWADDLQDRVGLTVDGFREALQAYTSERDKRATLNGAN